MHESFFTSHFDRNEKKLTKKNAELKRRIEEAIGEICNAPEKSKLLKGEFEGKRSYSFGNYRIVFAICGECRRRGFVRLNRCRDCGEKPDNSIVFFDIEHRKRVYK